MQQLIKISTIPRIDEYEIVIYSIVFFVIILVAFFLATLYERYKKIAKQKKQERYEPLVNSLLISVLFNEEPASDFKIDEKYQSYFGKKLFRELLINALIDLYLNYKGDYSKRLEQFYRQSGLIEDSVKKINSRDWELQCHGMNELSDMNITERFEDFVKISKTRNKTLKNVAINSYIKLDGTKGFDQLAQLKDPIDNWTQLNIIYTIKRRNIKNWNKLKISFASENPSVISLGIKIILEFKHLDSISFIEKVASETSNPDLKQEALSAIEHLRLA